MKGRNPSIPRTENSNGDACRPTAASQGIASADTWEPNSLIDWPVQSLRKSVLLHSPPLGRRSLRIGRPAVVRGDEAVRLPVGVVGGAEVVCELSEPAREPAGVVRGQAGSEEGEARPVVVVEGKHLLGGAAEGCRCDVPDAFAFLLGALEEEEPRRPAVILLRQRTHLPRPNHLDEARLLEHLHVVADRPLRQAELLRELGRRRCALAEQDDDLRAEIVAERAQLLVLAHDEHVNRLVVRRRKRDALGRGRRTGHLSEMYDFSRPFANSRSSRPGPGPAQRQPAGSDPAQRGLTPAFEQLPVKRRLRRWIRSWSRLAATASSRRGMSCTLSPCGTVRSLPRRGTPGSPASCARRRSRFRPCRSRARATTSTTAISPSPPRRTGRRPTRSPRFERCSRRHLPMKPTSSSDCRRDDRPSASTTTAPASTPECSRSAARMAGRPRATAYPSTPCSERAETRTPRRRASRPPSSPAHPTAAASSRSRCRSSGWHTRTPASNSSRRG